MKLFLSCQEEGLEKRRKLLWKSRYPCHKTQGEATDLSVRELDDFPRHRAATTDVFKRRLSVCRLVLDVVQEEDPRCGKFKGLVLQ